LDVAADIPAEPEREPRAPARETRAERYFEHDLAGQRRWFAPSSDTVRQVEHRLLQLMREPWTRPVSAADSSTPPRRAC
jgi:hypothetical protein